MVLMYLMAFMLASAVPGWITFTVFAGFFFRHASFFLSDIDFPDNFYSFHRGLQLVTLGLIPLDMRISE